MNYRIVYTSNPMQENTKILWQGVSENAKVKKNLEPARAFAYFIMDETDQIKGGCSGYLFYGCCFVDLLWVDKLLRNQSYGTKLMEFVETLARENQCHFMAVNTMNFEAPDFYKKLGFYIEFERRGFVKDSVLYFLRKDLV